MTRSLGVLVFAAVGLGSSLVGCSSDDSTTAKDPAASVPAPAGPTNVADELQVNEIAVYQAVKTTLMTEGELVAPEKQNAPVVAGRPAFVRVWVKAIGRTRPLVAGELRVKRAGKPDLVVKDSGRQVTPELDNSDLQSTLNFAIAAEDMTADASFSVKAGVKLDGDVLTYPAGGGTVPFGAQISSQKLRVKFVPVSYEAEPDTSLTPDLGDMATLKETLYKMYPVAEVEMTVRAPLKWSTPVKADGPGWNELLSGIMQLRRADNVARDIYYVGVFTPKPTIDQFCEQGGCILGIAPQADERSVGMRAALVLGYKNRGAGSTLAQELAHAMGRMHAPCGNPQAIDDDFPYKSGGIGVWGYDIVTKALVDPGNRYRDFMSYCGPTWTSDYTFKGIYERMDLVTKQQQAIDAQNGGSTGSTPAPSGGSSEIRPSFFVAADGTVTQGPDLEVIPGDATASEHALVSYEGANGKVVAAGNGRVVNVAGTGSRIVVAPAVPRGATHARVSNVQGRMLTSVRTALRARE